MTILEVLQNERRLAQKLYDECGDDPIAYTPVIQAMDTLYTVWELLESGGWVKLDKTDRGIVYQGRGVCGMIREDNHEKV